MSIKYVVYAVLFTAALSCALTRYYWPTEKVISKDVVKETVVTRTRVIKQPDGTIIKEREQRDTTKKSISQIQQPISNWIVQVGISTNKDYNVHISRRLLGPIFLGVGGSTDKSININIGVQF